jgi:hypothetical protein
VEVANDPRFRNRSDSFLQYQRVLSLGDLCSVTSANWKTDSPLPFCISRVVSTKFIYSRVCRSLMLKLRLISFGDFVAAGPMLLQRLFLIEVFPARLRSDGQAHEDRIEALECARVTSAAGASMEGETAYACAQRLRRRTAVAEGRCSAGRPGAMSGLNRRGYLNQYPAHFFALNRRLQVRGCWVVSDYDAPR